jgi:hypothetical protein
MERIQMKGFRTGIWVLLIILAAGSNAAFAGPAHVFQQNAFDQDALATGPQGTFSVLMQLYSTNPPYSGGYGGGAFKATIKTAGVYFNQAFPTFCLEYNEHFSPGATYNATIDDAALYNGANGGNGDPVSKATQLLYKTFLLGQLDGVALGGGYVFNYEDVNSYTELQKAFWSLEEETNWLSVTGLSDALKSWANSTAQNIDYGVRAMNLWNGTPYNSDNKRQSQLIWVSVPEPSSLVLLAVSLAAMGAKFRFRQRHSK